MSVILETTLGDIVIDLYTKERPRACLNFLKLCKIKYYNYCLVHSVQRNFMMQTGDPTGTGRGGESIFEHLYGEQARYFDAEALPKIRHTKLGTVSMVNNGNNKHGSQFFITTAEDVDYLDGIHTVFGEVAEGEDVLQKINEAICDEGHRPYQDIRISHTVILDDPYDDPPLLQVPDRSPEPSQEVLQSDRIGAHEDLDENKGKSLEEIEEEIQEKEAKARATILEMVGDIPDVEVKPPENVLFVCKLNPVTTDEDLHVIFSRFGKINSCEIIRDKKSNDSLQYSFIEFDREEDCENAFFKMDNVLIDDRRIHVDFSQSVAKLKWKGKGKGVEDLRTDGEKRQQKFVIKDKSKPQQGNYKMVFEDDEPQEYRPEKREDRRRSPSSDEVRPRREKRRSPPRSERGRQKSSYYDDRGSSSRASGYEREHRDGHGKHKKERREKRDRRRERRSRSRS